MDVNSIQKKITERTIERLPYPMRKNGEAGPNIKAIVEALSAAIAITIAEIEILRLQKGE